MPDKSQDETTRQVHVGHLDEGTTLYKLPAPATPKIQADYLNCSIGRWTIATNTEMVCHFVGVDPPTLCLQKVKLVEDQGSSAIGILVEILAESSASLLLVKTSEESQCDRIFLEVQPYQDFTPFATYYYLHIF